MNRIESPSHASLFLDFDSINQAVRLMQDPSRVAAVYSRAVQQIVEFRDILRVRENLGYLVIKEWGEVLGRQLLEKNDAAIKELQGLAKVVLLSQNIETSIESLSRLALIHAEEEQKITRQFPSWFSSFQERRSSKDFLHDVANSYGVT